MSNLEPLPAVLVGMIEPQDLKRRILQAVQEGYATLSSERGEVTIPEDTYATQRALATAAETLKGYAEAFKAGASMVATLQQEELVEAVGEQDGVPNSGLTVPDPNGDIRLTVRTENEYEGDADQLAAVVAGEVLTFSYSDQYPTGVELVRAIVEGDTGHPDDLAEQLRDMMADAIHRMLTLGKFSPQVSKVKTYADQLSRNGMDDLAGAARTSMSKRSTYKGVTAERKGLK